MDEEKRGGADREERVIVMELSEVRGVLNEMRSGGAEGNKGGEGERGGGVYVTLQSQKQTDEGGEPVSSKSCDVLFFFFSLSLSLTVTQLTCQAACYISPLLFFLSLIPNND